LQRALERYIVVLMAQFATASVCLRFHHIAPRLARWILMSHDRAHCDTFRMTHEFLGHMLGVRRVGITTAAAVLQRRGLIEYRRGLLTVLDRSGLEQASCACYAADLRAYCDRVPAGPARSSRAK
jgi:CRP-like cAMP-binding protein